MKYKVILIGSVLAVIAWIMESAIHVLIFHEGTFIRQMFSPASHEIWMRSLVGAAILLLGVSVAMYVVDLKRVEQALKLAYAELIQIFNASADGMRVIDKDFNMLRINKTFATLAGVSQDEAVGKKCYEVFPGPRCHSPDCPLARVLGGEKCVKCEVEKERTDGTRITCIVTATPFRRPDGDLIGIVENFKDITERRRLEKEILEISEQERQRIGQDLHDDLGQKLTGIAFLSKALTKQLASMSTNETSGAAKITDLANEAVDRCRRLARELYPVELERGDLTSALEELTRNVEELHGITCIFRSEYSALLDDRRVDIHLYRIAQEAINNALKHAKATKIVVNLEINEDSIRLAISDDGIGLPEDFESRAGIGRHSIQYRASMIGAVLRIQPGEKGGTEVICSMIRDHYCNP